MKSQAYVAVYLVLVKDGELLMSLRENTGYGDGMWSLVAGHQDVGEAASSAMVREAHEEAGIIIKPSDLKPIHMMHRVTDREFIDIFFECHTWKNTPENKEPHKCGGVKFFPLGKLPKNTLPYVKEAIEMGRSGTFFSEQGWPKQCAIKQ